MQKNKIAAFAGAIFVFAFAVCSCGGGATTNTGAATKIDTPAKPWENIDIQATETVVEYMVGEETRTYTVIDRTQVCLSKFDLDVDGWYHIFNGENLNGWRGYNRTDVPARWTVCTEHKAIKFSGTRQGETQSNDGGDILFGHKFKNFRLSIDWMVSPRGNSGIFYLSQEIKNEPVYISAPESQVLDNDLENGHPDAQAGANRMSSSLYDMIAADPQNANPAGQWNNTTILVDRGTVVHFQNGEKVLDYNYTSPQWIMLLQDSKFSQERWPIAFELLSKVGGPNREGYIALQDHGDDVWFRNIKVKVLD
jgi:hypothetical protein